MSAGSKKRCGATPATKRLEAPTSPVSCPSRKTNIRIFPLGTIGAGWNGRGPVVLRSGNMALASAPTKTRLERTGTFRCSKKLKTRPLKNARKNPRSEMCESDLPFFESIGVKKFAPPNPAVTEEVFGKIYPRQELQLVLYLAAVRSGTIQQGKIFRAPYNLFAAFPGHEQIEWRAEDGDHREPSQSTFVCLWRDMWRIGSSKTITTSFRRMYLTMTSRIIAVRSTQSRRRRHRRSKTTWKDRTPGGPCLPLPKSHRKEKEARRKIVESPRCPPRNRSS